MADVDHRNSWVFPLLLADPKHPKPLSIAKSPSAAMRSWLKAKVKVLLLSHTRQKHVLQQKQMELLARLHLVPQRVQRWQLTCRIIPSPSLDPVTFTVVLHICIYICIYIYICMYLDPPTTLN